MANSIAQDIYFVAWSFVDDHVAIYTPYRLTCQKNEYLSRLLILSPSQQQLKNKKYQNRPKCVTLSTASSSGSIDTSRGKKETNCECSAAFRYAYEWRLRNEALFSAVLNKSDSISSVVRRRKNIDREKTDYSVDMLFTLATLILYFCLMLFHSLLIYDHCFTIYITLKEHG